MNQQVSTDAKSWVKKLTSRKFLMALVPAIAAICALFGYSENQVITIASAAVIVISSVGYMYTEGKCDQESINASIEALQDIIASLTSENNHLKLELSAYEEGYSMGEPEDAEDVDEEDNG